ncbi:MAG: tRNA-dihydrouridine synthase family protein [Lentisphaeria bacterium]|nr:tRNA-dihydrouridine synthase family protein [Lentisphaeria bacterium]
MPTSPRLPDSDPKILYPAGAMLMAPLAGYTDAPYRRTMRRHGCRFAFTEMVDAAALVYARERTRLMLLRGEGEDFLGVQLLGGDPELLKGGIDVLNEYDFEVLDFNLGCPVPKVTKKFAGAELGRHVDEALTCFSLFPGRSKFPLTAKIRILSEEDPEPTVALAKGLAELGAQAITIHGRVKKMIYSGPVFYDIIAEVVKRVPVPIIGNGGIMAHGEAADMLRKTGCHAVMAARGAMGNPWIFDGSTPTVAELCSEILIHIREMIGLYGEESAMHMARKMVHDYFRGRGFAGVFRSGASHLSTEQDLVEMLNRAPEAHPGGPEALCGRGGTGGTAG